MKQYVEEFDEKWDRIAEFFPDRSDVQCQQRWTKVVNPELVKGPWTKEVIHSVLYLGVERKMLSMTSYVLVISHSNNINNL